MILIEDQHIISDKADYLRSIRDIRNFKRLKGRPDISPTLIIMRILIVIYLSSLLQQQKNIK